MIAAVVEILEEHGYEPRRQPHGVALTNCPFDALARDHSELICAMNRALIEGVLVGLGAGRLEASLDPAPARCCVRLVERS